MGDNLRSASGTTGKSGICTLKEIGGEELVGVSPGFYRVQITKSGEKIPAKYNTETTLGQEVARDAKNIEGIPIDLNY